MAQLQTIGTHKTTVAHDKQGDMMIVTYHNTHVVMFNNNHIFLDSGGWRTNTTKTRMNQTSNQFGLGFQVYQKNYEWFVDFSGKTLNFEDNMMLTR